MGKRVADEAVALEAAVKKTVPPSKAAFEAACVTGPPAPTGPPGRWQLPVVIPCTSECGSLVTVSVHGKQKQVCKRSFFMFSMQGFFRRWVLAIVEYVWFDRLILICIVYNSFLMAIEPKREGPEAPLNRFIATSDNVLLAIFTTECTLKVIAWGLIFDRKTYLRDTWNWLDFIVVVSGLVEHIPGTSDSGLGFLRLFRVLRPLRSLNAVPQMKVLVNTVLSSIPRLGNVAVMGAFLFVVFGIVGMTMMRGVLYRRCYQTRTPELSEDGTCWHWLVTDDERLCGGRYMCEDSGGFCRGLEDDPEDDLKAVFPGGLGMNSLPWCEDSAGTAMRKLIPETDFVHFDHIGGALLLIFQCMTLEGWTELMYFCQDSSSMFVATSYFFCLVLITSFFMLNVALAVVDEARADFDKDDEEEEEGSEGSEEEAEGTDLKVSEEEDGPRELWWDNKFIAFFDAIAHDEIFMNFVMLAIVANVIIMMLEMFPDRVTWIRPLFMLNMGILVIFIIEMIIMVLAKGPEGYVKDPVTCFDGVVVIVSVIEMFVGGGGALKALRTLRLFRVLNKLANRISSLKVLLKAMVYTGISLNYWLVLFLLVLYICTLMTMQIFANNFHFEDTDDLAAIHSKATGDPWCPDTERMRWNLRQDCIPRAHFDTFPWAFVTVYQIMTGENWNTIMYAGMRAKGWVMCLLFVGLILFGQTLFLSLFLSMLMSKFDKVQDEMEEQEEERQKKVAEKRRLEGENSDKLTKFGSVKNILKKFSASTLRNGKVDENGEPESPVSPIENGSTANGDAPGKEHGTVNGSAAKEVSYTYGMDDDDLPRTLTEEEEKEEKAEWPKGYACFWLSKSNPIRILAMKVLEFELEMAGSKYKVFDNIVLLCILLSSICMAVDSPLNDPEAQLTKILRGADYMFGLLFIFEMVVKLFALGIWWGEDAYLKSGWNWLDGVVVMVSIVDIITDDGPAFLKTLRILRAFRPLRVISRNENLKVVVQTVFLAIPDLGTLVFVAMLFLLMFALISIMYWRGAFYACSDDSIPFLRSAGDDFVVPMCLGNAVVSESSLTALGDIYAVQRSAWNESSGQWTSGACSGDYPIPWVRPSADTPLCIGRCDPFSTGGEVPDWLCPRRYEKTEELPSLCETPNSTWHEEEAVGKAYVAAMQRQLLLPCGGAALSMDGEKMVEPKPGLSCRDTFCKGTVSAEKKASCADQCKIHPYFCVAACSTDIEGDPDARPTCLACREECEAACQCDHYCEPLALDAAVCVELGHSWEQTLSQNFDNIWNSMITLFEISTTEGWVDVMYAAADATGPYTQPLRDVNMYFSSTYFVVWIFVSFMFLINLSVGVIVDKYMDLKEDGSENPFATEGQNAFLKNQWLKYRNCLEARANFFSLQNLHELPSWRRTLYGYISSKAFDSVIMGLIILMTLLMMLQVFPGPASIWSDESPPPRSIGWWEDTLNVFNMLFALAFTVEAALKLICLQKNYWKDNWNCFDFACVVATIAGMILSYGFKLKIASITSAIRIFRIARLFRLLKFLKGLNRLFMALIMSLPSLMNVIAILLLLLTLFSILGVSMFGTVSTDLDTHNIHGNFRNFFWAFVTLFRASTGEAWNEVMHDLSRDEVDFFRGGSWCTPAELFDWNMKYDVLRDKCLVDTPNACVQTFGGWNPLPKLYWVMYTLIIGFMIMNLVITVILDGYERGKEGPETEIIDTCIQIWKEYDPDHKMKLEFRDAMAFIQDCTAMLSDNHSRIQAPFGEAEPSSPFGMNLSGVPMRVARLWDLKLEPDRKVSFLNACSQILRLTVLDDNDEFINELQVAEDTWMSMRSKRQQKSPREEPAEGEAPEGMETVHLSLMTHIAAAKVARRWRQKAAAKAALRKTEVVPKKKEPTREPVSQSDPQGEPSLQILRETASVTSLPIQPPVAG
eukprot:TRINITY_DN50994_c0_g1_i1.p1 TRINITY_DN50994_c0_g1~~TRINITY_DN50994_c0_g1_i1.p1  ORF type:complete len:1913 (-),score=432.16 TRINITY_DN50994_c0_g1_i1:94-5832(-)